MPPVHERRMRAAVCALALAVAFAAIRWAYAAAFQADGLPLWDSAGYLLEAEKLRARVAALDLRGVAASLTHPDLHPPLHSALLGAWMLVAGNDLDAARLYPLACFVAALALLPVMGRLAYGPRGWAVGAVAAMVTAHARGNLELVATPMTESTGLVATFGALALATGLRERSDARARIAVGMAILLATLVRWNLGPMLLAPLVLEHAWRHRRERARLLDPGLVAWVAPTAVTLAGWALLRPELYENIRKFLENRSSGLETWSWDNLGFVLIAAQRDYLGSWLVVAPLAVLVGASCLARDRAGILRAYLAVAVALLTVHDFKIARNLAGVLPVAVLVGVGALAEAGARLPIPAVGKHALAAIGVLGMGLGWGGWQRANLLVDLPKRVDFQPDPSVRQALDFMARHAAGAPGTEQTWVTGWVFRLSPPLIDWWFRVHEVPGRLQLDQVLLGEQSRTGADAAWHEGYAARVRDVMLAESERARTTYITVETAVGSRYWDAWKAFGNNYARAMAEQEIVPEIDRLDLVDAGLLLRVYRAGGTPSAATVDASSTAPRPEDDVGISRPPGVDPYVRDTLAGSARRWQVFPPEALDKVRVARDGGALEVRVAAPVERLMACDRAQAAPAPEFRAVLNVSAEDVQGKAFVHLRGMGPDDQLQKLPDGAWDITHGGPLVDGGQVVERDVRLGPESPKVRACIVLDQVTGTFRVLDLAYYPLAAPRLVASAPTAAPGAPGSAGAPAEAAAGLGPSRGWTIVPPGAPVDPVPLGVAGASVDIAVAVPALQLCAESWKVEAPPGRASVRARARGLRGKAWVHVRALGADGALLRQADGRGWIEQFGPLADEARIEASRELRFPPETRIVRSCVVLDGVTGHVDVEEVAISP